METKSCVNCGFPCTQITNPERVDWFVNYDMCNNETSLVICGSDSIGVLFLILKNDHIEDFKKVIKESEGFNKYIHGCLCECIRWAVRHPDIEPEKCTIGGFGCKPC